MKMIGDGVGLFGRKMVFSYVLFSQAKTRVLMTIRV